MWKFKSLKGKDKWQLLLTVGVILCILAFPVESMMPKNKDTKKETPQIQTEGNDSVPAGATPKGQDSYEKELEERVREILKTVDGVGQVDVMIVLKASEEKVFRVDKSAIRSTTEETDSSGGNRRIENEDLSEATVFTTGDGKSIPVVEKERKPELSGIIISASGGGSLTVRAEISAAMEALFDLPAHKIKVLKRVE